MPAQNTPPARHSVQTASGRISYTDQGSGPVALFAGGRIFFPEERAAEFNQLLRSHWTAQ